VGFSFFFFFFPLVRKSVKCGANKLEVLVVPEVIFCFLRSASCYVCFGLHAKLPPVSRAIFIIGQLENRPLETPPEWSRGLFWVPGSLLTHF